jgi:hypothetical protein
VSLLILPILLLILNDLMILDKKQGKGQMRDKRFIAEHRGGSLKKAQQSILSSVRIKSL